MKPRSKISSFTPLETTEKNTSLLLHYKKACNRKFLTGFTLVELLIVIAILAVLAAAVVIVLNPAELLAQARDSQRISDINTIGKSIRMFVVDNPSSSMGADNTVYISIPDTSATCANISGLATLPAGWSYHCVVSANLRNTDGTGWVPLNLSSIFGGTPIPYLPLDPDNTSSSRRYYSYAVDSDWKLSARLESEKYLASASGKDGGSDPLRFEDGTFLGFASFISDSLGFWPLEADTYDISGFERDASASGSSPSVSLGRGSYSFNGSGNYISIPSNDPISASEGSISLWIKFNELSRNQVIFISGANTADGFGAVDQFVVMLRGSDNKIVAGWQTSGDNDYSFSTSAVDTSSWYHIVAKWAGGYNKLYVNTVMTGDEPNTGNGKNNWVSEMRLGGSMGAAASPYWFNGYIKGLRTYSRALGDSEVKALYADNI